MMDAPARARGAPEALIVVASKHGGTRGIAEAVQQGLTSAGARVTLASAEDAPPPLGFDVVVLGSAIYVGRWMDELKAYAARHSEALRGTRVHLFSSGPLGKPADASGDSSDASRMAALTGARSHVVFAGRLDREGLSLAERAMVRMVKERYGDFRDLGSARAWGAGVLSPVAEAGARPPTDLA
jgi:menaquinone-dependent protoporphyrinogen oxidase